MLIATGILASIIALWQYRGMLHYLWRTEFEPVAGVADAPGHTRLVGVALVLIFIGLFAFFSVFLRF